MSADFNDILFKRAGDAPADRPAPTVAAIPGEAEAYALTALEREVEAVETAAPGTRNHTLNTAAYNLGQLVAGGHLQREVVESHLFAAALRAGLEQGESHATIASGITGGMKFPRTVEPPQAKPLPTLGDLGMVAVALTPHEPGVNIGPVGEWTAPSTPEELAALQEQVFAQRVANEAAQQRIRRAARKVLDDEDAVASFRVPTFWPSLTAEFREPEVEVQWAIDRLLPAGGNVLLTAAFKAGKTTLVNNLARAYADDLPFLGCYGVHPEEGKRIALFNYEVDPQQYRRWLRDARIKHTDRIVLLHLRGHRLPLTVPHVEDWVVDWLAANNVGTWVVDPFARAFTGCGDENDNSAVGVFLDTLDVIKARAGVRDLVLTTHTGRAEQEQGSERARGATRLDDWADVRWLLNRTKDGKDRVLSATGRDVDVDEGKLEWDEPTRHLTFTEGVDRRQMQVEADAQTVVDAVRDEPGILTVPLMAAVGGRKEHAKAAIKWAIDHRLIYTQVGARGAISHHPMTTPQSQDSQDARRFPG